MRKLIYNAQVSLDGVMQAPGGPDEDRECGFEHGGWAMPYFQDELMLRAAEEGMGSAEALLLGRKTYDIFAAYWPHQGDDVPFAGFLNKVQKHVVSTTLTEPLEWANSTLIQGDVVEGVRKLKETEGGTIVMLGSTQLAQTLTEHDLIDEYEVWLVPVILGGGKRLFREGLPRRELELVNERRSSTGVLLLTYRRANGSSPRG